MRARQQALSAFGKDLVRRSGSKCELCEAPTEMMINCANAACNKHFLICADCAEKLEGCCCEECMHSERRRKFDGTGYYLRGVNSKEYVGEGKS